MAEPRAEGFEPPHPVVPITGCQAGGHGFNLRDPADSAQY
jgi:hypothetical protein